MIYQKNHNHYDIYLSEKNEGSINTKEQACNYLTANQIKIPVCYFHHQHQAQRFITSSSNCNQEIWADSAITNRPNICLAMIVADCLPIVLFDSQQKVLALVHGGWKPLLQNILELTILDMQLKFNSAPKHIQAWIGPGIRACCYHFKSQPLQAQLPTWQDSVTDSKEGWVINLPRYVKQELVRLGITADQIIDSQQCTACQPQKYFSHYRSTNADEKDGRMMVAARLLP